jgi:hypothetical protein
MNGYQLTVMHTLGWVFVLFDGWELHSHWLAGAGFIMMIASMYLITKKGD